MPTIEVLVDRESGDNVTVVSDGWPVPAIVLLVVLGVVLLGTLAYSFDLHRRYRHVRGDFRDERSRLRFAKRVLREQEAAIQQTNKDFGVQKVWCLSVEGMSQQYLEAIIRLQAEVQRLGGGEPKPLHILLKNCGNNAMDEETQGQWDQARGPFGDQFSIGECSDDEEGQNQPGLGESSAARTQRSRHRQAGPVRGYCDECKSVNCDCIELR